MRASDTAHGFRTTMLGAAAAICLLVTLVLPTSAGATIVERERYEGTDGFSYDFCGFDVDVDVAFHGVASIRAGKGKLESAFFLHDRYWYMETHSANGKYFTISSSGLFQETKAVPLGGTLFQFTAVEAGKTFTLRDMDGTVLLRDRGSVIRTIVFDTLGDDVPGGVFVEDLDLRLNGPHPSFLTDETQACALLAPDPA